MKSYPGIKQTRGLNLGLIIQDPLYVIIKPSFTYSFCKSSQQPYSGWSVSLVIETILRAKINNDISKVTEQAHSTVLKPGSSGSKTNSFCPAMLALRTLTVSALLTQKK